MPKISIYIPRDFRTTFGPLLAGCGISVLSACLLTAVWDPLCHMSSTAHVPGTCRDHLHQAKLEMKLGHCDSALRHCDEAIRVNPAEPDAWETRAGVLNQVNRAAEANDDHEQALSLAPKTWKKQQSKTL